MFSELLLNGSALKHVQQQQKSREKGAAGSGQPLHPSAAGGSSRSSRSRGVGGGGGGASSDDDDDLLITTGPRRMGSGGSASFRSPFRGGGGGSSNNRAARTSEGDPSSSFLMARSTALDVRPMRDVILPGPAMRDTAPLRQLFSEHIEQVCRIPVILNNMPRYYAIVGSALDTALEQAEFELRAQNVQFQAEADAQKGIVLGPRSQDAGDSYDNEIDDDVPLVPLSCTQQYEDDDGEDEDISDY